jgi:hypothetical protein
MRKKSTIFAIIGVLCVAVAMYFMYKETRDTYDVFIDDEPEPETDIEAETTKEEPANVQENAKNGTETSSGIED